MKRLALVLTLLMLSSAAQAQDYEEETTLYCVWPDGRIESFTEGGSYRSPIGLSDTWIVMDTFTDHEADQPESDNFTPAD